MNIIPAIIPQSLEDVFAQAKRLKSFTREVHIDVVDGIFADPISWPYMTFVQSGNEGAEINEPNAVRSLADMFDIEFDLMVEDALFELPRYLSARPKRIVFHLESTTSVPYARMMANDLGVKCGLAVGNDAPLELYLDELVNADYAQCMGIASVGAQGRMFDPRVLPRIRAIRAEYPEMEITVDGSVNRESIQLLADAGATRFIVGSAIVRAEDPALAYAELLKLAGTAAMQQRNIASVDMHTPVLA